MRKFLVLSLSIASVALSLGARADLDSYFKRPEPAFTWSKTEERSVGKATISTYDMVSQVWQGITWKHRVQIFRPAVVRYPGSCGLLNVGGGPRQRFEEFGLEFALRTSAPYAILYDSPNQPIYGLEEDALIAHTYMQYMKTGNEDWPLHLPMAKSVLKAMDVIQAATTQAGHAPITGFVPMGLSKRGWTTWLVGASNDPRVKAIVPMVIDCLRVSDHLKLQIEEYGPTGSEEIADYITSGFNKVLDTPPGKRLMEIEDPYSYRDRMTLPKLLVLGTNDQYWPQGSLNLYWDGLKGPKWVLYCPNSRHDLEDRERLYSTVSAFIRMIASGSKWPSLAWSYTPAGDGYKLNVTSSVPPKSARLFRAFAPTRDLRPAQWVFDPMSLSAGNAEGRMDRSDEAYGSMFAELTFADSVAPFTLSTQVHLLPKRGK